MRKIVRDRILAKFGNKCCYCNSTENLEIDHIIPLSKGGKEDEINMQVLCRACNRRKSNKFDVSKYFNITEHGKRNGYILISRDFPIGTITPHELCSFIEQHLLMVDEVG